MLEKPWSEKSSDNRRAVFDGKLPTVPFAASSTLGVVRISLPPLPTENPTRSACNQSELSEVEKPLAMDKVPPLPAVILRELLKAAPPPTSSNAPFSRNVAEVLEALVAIEIRPPSSKEAVLVLPSAATFKRAVGSASPTNEPSTLALLIHTPAVDSVAPSRTMTLFLSGVISASIGLPVPTG